LRTPSRFKGARRPGRAGSRKGVPALGYASVPGDVPLSGAEVEQQLLVIQDACEELGLGLIDVVREHEPPDSESRPGLSYVLERLDAGEASCLVVSDLERLTREVAELASVVDRLERSHVRLVAIDVGLDTATPHGRTAVSPREVHAPVVEVDAAVAVATADAEVDTADVEAAAPEPPPAPPPVSPPAP
jgi:Resolvase, N terminal domain